MTAAIVAAMTAVAVTGAMIRPERMPGVDVAMTEIEAAARNGAPAAIPLHRRAAAATETAVTIDAIV